MFRLLKLAAYALLGYALYEFFRGMSDESGGRQQTASQPSKRGRGNQKLSDALNRDPARGQALTGEGRGTTVATADATGGSAKHVVGRGVVSR